MAHDEARYEYRCFAPSLGSVEAQLRAAGGAPQTRESSDVYFISRLDQRHNVKIRDGQLDIKVLLEVRDSMQRWNPLARLDFPLAGPVLSEVLAPALGLKFLQLPRGSGASAQQLVRALTGHVDIVVVELFKRRFGFLIDGCIAEYAEVTMRGATIRTACVESVAPAHVRRVVADLGLDAFPNTSYPAALRSLLSFGWPQAN